MTKKQQEEEEIDSVNITVLLKISLSRSPPGSLSPRSNGWVCARLCRWVSTGSWGSSCIACAGSWRLRKREEKKRHLVSRSQDRDAACAALAAPAPAALEKHGQPRRQRCPAGGCVCPGTNPPARAQSALLSPLRLGVGFTRGRRCPPGAWGGAASSPRMLVASLSLCPARGGCSANGVGTGTASPSSPLCCQSRSKPRGQGGEHPPAVGCAQGTGGETAPSGRQGQGFRLIFAASLPWSWHCSREIFPGGF